MSNTDVNTNGTTTNADAAVLAANIETEKAAKPKKEKPAKPEKATSATIVKDVPLKDIILPEQNVRTELTGMDELIASVKEQGVLQPGIGVQLPDGKVKLTAGQRRFLASKEAGKSTMPIRIVDADDLDQHEIAMVENLQREDMNPLDKAVGIQKMMSDRDCDQKEAARRLSVSDGFISQHLSLLKPAEAGPERGEEREDRPRPCAPARPHQG
jgi:ParB/RepB/Spo0J family partition protein